MAASAAYGATTVSIEIGELRSSAVAAKNLQFDYTPTGALKLRGTFRQATAAAPWMDASLSCAGLQQVSAGHWQCTGGELLASGIKLPFTLLYAAGGTSRDRPTTLRIDLNAASFSDAAGLRAGEQVSGVIQLAAYQQAQNWHWRADVDWAGGEVFWQPFYFANGGHRLLAHGQLRQQEVLVEHAKLSLRQVGELTLDARLSRADLGLQSLNASTGELDLDPLYQLLLKPLLEKTTLNDLQLAGKGRLAISMRDAQIRSFEINLQQADLEDGRGRFALYKIDASLPWDYDRSKPLRLQYAGGRLLRLPLGAADLHADINRYALTAAALRLPLLDGALQLSDISAAWAGNAWHWHLRADLQPVSMTEFSHALGWPLMQGKASFSIPLVTYSGGKLTTDGALLFNVFNGKVSVHELAMQDPFGIIPKLSAELQLRKLDLGELTRTFSFGSMEGKLDGDVKQLRLANWKPVQFDASIYSSPGRYPRKISQRAVENISSLGGAGAAAAVQRSVLRFFDDFNYDKIGLSCRLRNDTCLMGGVENQAAVNSNSGSYVIVKGRGVPAITVLGYNRQVGWSELLARLKRITEGNSKPVIQ